MFELSERRVSKIEREREHISERNWKRERKKKRGGERDCEGREEREGV